jgi:PIN domain nuclease of toxin-antitoxin system
VNLLLDTHVFLWYISKDSRLDARIEQLIRQPENRIYLSAVSLWECLVKHRLGKLNFPEPPEEYLPTQRQRHAIESLPLDEASVHHLSKLPDLHRDPFDRMLICQAIEHGLTLMTVDRAIKQYPVATFPMDA